MTAHELAKALLETEDLKVKIYIRNEYEEIEATYEVEDIELYIEAVHSSKGELVKSKDLSLAIIQV